MRISDWSSDVCSSDLARTFRRSLSPCGTPDILPYRSAVIDIGSNSVRLVVYEGPPRAPAVIFNEKVPAGLGRAVSIAGRIPDEEARKRVGNGQRVDSRVHPGGRRMRKQYKLLHPQKILNTSQ